MYHKERQFDGQEMPEKIELNFFDSLRQVGGVKNGLEKDEMLPNSYLSAMNGEPLPAVWYLHSPEFRGKNRRTCKYKSLDEFGQPKEYSFQPSGWVLMEDRWLPLVLRVLRVLKDSDPNMNGNFLDRVNYKYRGEAVDVASVKENSRGVLTSLGAAENPFNIVYLAVGQNDQIARSLAWGKWLFLDTKNVGYKVACGASDRIYGPGCYFGGLWSCADRGSARKVDSAVCKVKDPPWETRYFWAVIDDIVFNAGSGSSIKSGRMRLINEDIGRIPDWVHLKNS